MENVLVIMGFMGSGKTTIGKALALALKTDFYDLDALIEQKTGVSISEIFETQGESSFRIIETEVLLDILCGPPCIVSLGGGTPCFNNNMDHILTKAQSLYLKVSPKELAARLIRSPNPRPLIKGKNLRELESYIHKTLHEREVYYQKADFVLESDVTRIEDVLPFFYRS